MTRVPNVPFRRPVTIAMAAVVVLLLAGCSDGSQEPMAGQFPNGRFTPSVADSATPTPTRPAARRVSGEVLARRLAGAAGRAGTVSFGVLTTGSQELKAQGVARIAPGGRTGGDLQISADSGGNGRIDVMRVAGKVYVRPPDGTQKVWIQVTNQPSDPFRTFYSQLFTGFESTGDVGVAARGIARMGTFTAAGTETVDGVKTIKWVATPPPATGVALLPRTYRSLDADALENGRTTVTLWIDATGLLHRTTTAFTVKGGQPSKALTTYGKWGRAVRLSAPPASSVVRGKPA